MYFTIKINRKHALASSYWSNWQMQATSLSIWDVWISYHDMQRKKSANKQNKTSNIMLTAYLYSLYTILCHYANNEGVLNANNQFYSITVWQDVLHVTFCRWQNVAPVSCLRDLNEHVAVYKSTWSLINDVQAKNSFEYQTS